MPEPATSIPLIFAAIASAVAFVFGLRRLRMSEGHRNTPVVMILMLVSIAVICVTVFVGRVVMVHKAWIPVQAHVDGLLLIATMLSVAILYIQSRPRLFGLSLFALPLLLLILSWGICASLWTYRPFNLDSFEPAWLVFHTTTTYLGLLGCGIGAACGAMYLFVQGRLKSKAGLDTARPMASLETIETLIIRSATLGFVLLTLSLLSGLVIVTQSSETTSLGSSWWASPKVWLASAAWVVYALLINIKSFSSVRGRRAAWLAIAGLVLVLATYGVVEVLDKAKATVSANTPSTQEAR